MKIVFVLMIALMLVGMIGTVAASTVVTAHHSQTYDGYRYVGHNLGIVHNMNLIPPGAVVGDITITVYDTPQNALISLAKGEVDALVLP
jgi:hypothetical protein